MPKAIQIHSLIVFHRNVILTSVFIINIIFFVNAFSTYAEIKVDILLISHSGSGGATSCSDRVTLCAVIK